MDYGMIGKIEKAKRYAEERERITFNAFSVTFQGDNNTYRVGLGNEGWDCTCPGFSTHSICPHIMTLEKLFKPMLKRAPLNYSPGQNVVSDIDKAARYAQETDRLTFGSFDVTFHGDNHDHRTSFTDGVFTCDCDFFLSRGVCQHTMAMERILKGMIHVENPSPASGD